MIEDRLGCALSSFGHHQTGGRDAIATAKAADIIVHLDLNNYQYHWRLLPYGATISVIAEAPSTRVAGPGLGAANQAMPVVAMLRRILPKDIPMGPNSF